MPVFITANFGRHASTAKFLRNVRAIDDEAGRGAVINTQEIDEADKPPEHHLLKEEWDDFQFTGWKTHEPIAFGDKWEIKHEEVTKGVQGLARLSPARPIIETLAVHSQGEILFMNMHYPRNDPRLRARWVQLRMKHKQRIAYWFNQGVTVVWSSDVNRPKFAPLHPAERILIHKGLDRIHCIEHPDGTQIKVLESGVIPMNIDGHDAPWVRVQLTRGI